MDCRLKEGMIVKHFKREISDISKNPNIYKYKIWFFAIHSETSERYVVYEALYTDKEKGIDHDIFIRPLDMFMSEVDHEKYPNIKQKYRFEECN